MNKLLGQTNLNTIQQNAGLTVSTSTSLGDLISKALPWIFIIAGMLLLIYLIFGGLQLMLSQGDPKNAQAAKAHITNALIGFIIIFIAFWVVQLFGAILGLRDFADIFGGSARIIQGN